jgi:hypothetical protein
VAYQDELDEIDLVWCIKGLSATRKQLMFTINFFYLS